MCVTLVRPSSSQLRPVVRLSVAPSNPVLNSDQPIMPICGQCKRDLSRAAFSKAQLRKDEAPRCKSCTAGEIVGPVLEPSIVQAGTAHRLYFDGGCRPNPGRGGCGTVLDGSSASFPLGECTSNIAEYIGLIMGLRDALAKGIQELEVFGDSELILRQMRGEYQVQDESLRVLETLPSAVRS